MDLSGEPPSYPAIPFIYMIFLSLSRYRSYRGYNYDAAYTSHAHGWSAGPTPALTFYILGLNVVSLQGKTWSVAPHVGGGLPGAEGGFETPLGWFGVKWTLASGALGPLTLTITTPTASSGVFRVPKGMSGNLTVDGAAKGKVTEGSEIALQGGTRSIVLQSSAP